jgi:hypothetical protein
MESAAITKTSASLEMSPPIRSTKVKRVYTIVKQKLAVVQDQTIFDEVIALHCLLMRRFVVITSRRHKISVQVGIFEDTTSNGASVVMPNWVVGRMCGDELRVYQ